jgi:quercetin dioxygenase-like cupin family protein
MTEDGELVPVVSDPDVQRGVWFLGALVKECVAGTSTGGSLAVLEHHGARGYNAPMHRHAQDDEAFVVLDGQVQLTINGELYVAGAGTSVFLPRTYVHGFVVSAPSARFLTVHTPAVFDRFAFEVGTAASSTAAGTSAPDGVVTPSVEELGRIAARYGLEITGPPPAIVDPAA